MSTRGNGYASDPNDSSDDPCGESHGGKCISMSWYAFPDEKSFTAWHDDVCATEGLPYYGYNQGSGKPAPDACWTTAYVEPVLDVASGVLLVQLDDNDPHALGLTEVNPPTFPDKFGAEQPVEPVAFDFAKPLPSVYRDATGVKPVPRTVDNEEVVEAQAVRGTKAP